ncbi:MAG: phosphoribosyltransferase [Acidobacteria bacterium]|nr:phosphoribosyltransferase [Acidobacteriota bacterium]
MTPLPQRFSDRLDAGRRLASSLGAYANRADVTVLGLPRGGVPVAAQVAASLHAPLDVLVVRKLGVPSQPELAMGAIGEGGAQVRHHDLIADIGLSSQDVDRVVAVQQIELERRVHLYRGSRAPAPLRDRTVILVDDGLATGATMEAAIASVRQHGPREVVVAVPVGAADTCRRLGLMADAIVCVLCAEYFGAVGQWYDDFAQTTDDEVTALLT